MPLTAKQRRDPGLSEDELKVVEQRVADDGLCALGLRFSEDKLVAAASASRRSRTGSATRSRSSRSIRAKGNAYGFGRMAHSVLTLEVREIDGHPAYEARKRVVEFLTKRLT